MLPSTAPQPMRNLRLENAGPRSRHFRQPENCLFSVSPAYRDATHQPSGKQGPCRVRLVTDELSPEVSAVPIPPEATLRSSPLANGLLTVQCRPETLGLII